MPFLKDIKEFFQKNYPTTVVQEEDGCFVGNVGHLLETEGKEAHEKMWCSYLLPCTKNCIYLELLSSRITLIRRVTLKLRTEVEITKQWLIIHKIRTGKCFIQCSYNWWTVGDISHNNISRICQWIISISSIANMNYINSNVLFVPIKT